MKKTTSRVVSPSPAEAALLLGYGSRGRTYAKFLSKAEMPLVIVDLQAAAREKAKADHPSAVVVESLDAIGPNNIDWTSTMALIATWGPSHAELFDRLVYLGVRRILCEKPLAVSVEQAAAIVGRAVQEGVFLTSYHYFRNSGFVSGLNQLAKSHDLGEPVAMVVSGGASCLVTNGIHFIDFAIQLFGSLPESVVSTAIGDPINPRSKALRFYGGSAVWTFSGGRELAMTLNNHSSVFFTSQVLYRDAIATITFREAVEADDWYFDVTLMRRDMSAVGQDQPVTRTGQATNMIFFGEPPGVLRADEALRLALKRLAAREADPCQAESAAASVSACIGALIAGREARTVKLPIEPVSAWGKEIWPIS